MAHKITLRDKQQGIEQAWHGLTEVMPVIDLDDCFLSKWDIKPVRLKTEGGELTDFSILVGSDDNKPIGKPFQDSYKPINNSQFLTMIKDAIGGIDDVTVASVGSVMNRGRVFVSLKLGKDGGVYKVGNREFNSYLNFGNGHDQSCVLWVNNTEICTVCNNTFSYNLRKVDHGGDLTVKISHRGDVEVKLENVAEIVDAHLGSRAKYKEEFETLLSKEMSTETAYQLYTGFLSNGQADIPRSPRFFNKVDRLTYLFREGAGNSGNSRADAFSAVTDYYTHENTRGGGANKHSQFVSSEFGLGRQFKTSFWDVIRSDILVDHYVQLGSDIIANT